MKFVPVLFFLIATLIWPIAHAGNNDVTGLFSTFHVSANSGDISGAEIHIVPNPLGFSAVVQASEGAPGFPEVIVLSVAGNQIEFSIPDDSASGFAPGSYIGSVSEKGLMLNGPKGTYEEYFLPRKSSFWE